eukprot:11280-Heterococcus_DN1.PRE.2
MAVSAVSAVAVSEAVVVDLEQAVQHTHLTRNSACIRVPVSVTVIRNTVVAVVVLVVPALAHAS